LKTTSAAARAVETVDSMQSIWADAMLATRAARANLGIMLSILSGPRSLPFICG
jgi:hypothetical protein